MKRYSKSNDVTTSLPEFDIDVVNQTETSAFHEFWVKGNTDVLIQKPEDINEYYARQSREKTQVQPTYVEQPSYDLGLLKFVAVIFFFMGFVMSSILMTMAALLVFSRQIF